MRRQTPGFPEIAVEVEFPPRHLRPAYWRAHFTRIAASCLRCALVIQIAMSPRGGRVSVGRDDASAGSWVVAANPADSFKKSLRVPDVKLSLQTASRRSESHACQAVIVNLEAHPALALTTTGPANSLRLAANETLATAYSSASRSPPPFARLLFQIPLAVLRPTCNAGSRPC